MSDMILFDLDGTLTDSGPGITRCVQYALASFGIEEPDLEKLNCYVGPPLLESFMNFAGLGCEEAQQAITKYRERYEAEGIFENEVYEGIPEVLAYLKEKGKILAVASSKPEKYVEQILEHFEIRKYFTVVTGSEMNETRTDKGEVIAETLRRLGAEDSRSDVVMVGDRSYDVIGARENGLLCVGVSYGYGGREELEAAGAAKVCDTPEELKLLAEDPKEEKKKTRIPIEGEIPSPVNPKPGCRFAARCKYATELCRSETPKLEEMEEGHYVACHRVKEI